MRRLLIALALLAPLFMGPAPVKAQFAPIYCIAGSLTQCNQSAQIGNGTQGDPNWRSFGKINFMENQFYSMFGSGTHLQTSGSANASDIVGLFSGCGPSTPALGYLGGCVSGGGGGTPGGPTGYIQYNNSGAFGGIATSGTGNVVLSTSATLTTPNLGTPSTLLLANATANGSNGQLQYRGYSSGTLAGFNELYYQCTGSGDNSTISSDITALSMIGGTLHLGAGTCRFSAPVTLASNVSIVGAPRDVMLNSTDMNQDWTPNNGTIITSGGANQAFIYNSTNQSTGFWATGTPLTGVNLEHLTFSGFSHGAVVVGAQNAQGLQFSNWRDLAFYQCGSVSQTGYAGGYPALWLYNFMGIRVEYIFETASYGLWFQEGNNVQQTGNSDIQFLTSDTFGMTAVPSGATASAANFVREFVFGEDPNYTTVNNTEPGLHISFIQGQSAEANYNNDVGSVTAASSPDVEITTNLANWPVGMPVQFNAGNVNHFARYVTYWVTSQVATGVGSCPGSGNVGCVTLALCRGCSPVTSNATATGAITSAGYPILDLGGAQGTTGGISNSRIDFIGVGGIASPSIYAEASVNNALEFNGVGAGLPQVLLGMRYSSAVIESTGAEVVVDEDTNSSQQSIFNGNINQRLNSYQYGGGTQGGAGAGIVYDSGNATFGLNLTNQNMVPTSLSTTSPDIWYGCGDACLLSNFGIGQGVIESTATSSCAFGSNAGYDGGFATIVMEQGTPTSCTLPALSNSSVYLGTIGLTFFVYNNGTATNVVTPSAASAGQYFNDNSGYTSVVLAPGQWAMFVGVYSTTNSRTFWAVQTTAALTGSQPTIASGFGSSPSIAASTGSGLGPYSYSVNVGAGGSASSGVVTLPTAPHGWACSSVDDGATPTGYTVPSAHTTSSVTVTNFGKTTGTAVAWTASEILELQCTGN